MWQQILAIAGAQFRITRNRFPRTSVGAVLHACFSILWQGMFAGFAVFLAVWIPRLPVENLREWLPSGLLGLLLYWQIVPLLTLSAGWSLQLNRIQIYPIPTGALLAIEIILRITASPETISVLLGALVGLMRHPAVPLLAPVFLLLYVPFNLFLQLAVRESISNAFERSRFRELLTVLLISIAVLPQLLLRSGMAGRATPYFLAIARNVAAPWSEVAALSLGYFSLPYMLAFVSWTLLCFVWARQQFTRGLLKGDSFRAASAAASREPRPSSRSLRSPWAWLAQVFNDPLAALLEKELRSLLRMPRFRVIFGMACVFGVIVFVPVSFRGRHSNFMSQNFLPTVNLYGLLLLSDVLLLNVFGFDRGASELFFAAPIPFRAVILAKNLSALLFIALQTAAVLLFVLLIRVPLTGFEVASAAAASAVTTVFLLSAGNLLSVSMPRPLDPATTFRKQSGGQMQLWLLLCSVGMLLLVGFPLLARWAVQKDWVFFAVALLELGIGLIVYWIAVEAAVERALSGRERIVNALSKGASPVSSTLGL
jgi:ABC-2 type transport system permease protein